MAKAQSLIAIIGFVAVFLGIYISTTTNNIIEISLPTFIWVAISIILMINWFNKNKT